MSLDCNFGSPLSPHLASTMSLIQFLVPATALCYTEHLTRAGELNTTGSAHLPSYIESGLKVLRKTLKIPENFSERL
jgi:hypothetical protein